MKNPRLLVLWVLLALSLPYTYGGCSGGGGDGGGGGTAGFAYSGVTDPAQISESNAEEISGAALGAGLVSNDVAAISTAGVSEPQYIGSLRSVKIPLILSDFLGSISFPAAAVGSAQATFTRSNSIDGNCGGTMAYTITVNDAEGTFEGEAEFSKYCQNSLSIDGGAGFCGLIDLEAGNFLEVDFSFDHLGAGDLVLDGEINIDFATFPIAISFNADAQDLGSGKVYRVEDYTIDCYAYAGLVEIEMAGIFYHPDYGRVTISTPEPLVLYDGDEWLTSGTLAVAGSSNTNAKITVIDYLTYIIEVDVDGDGVYEWDSGILSR